MLYKGYVILSGREAAMMDLAGGEVKFTRRVNKLLTTVILKNSGEVWVFHKGDNFVQNLYTDTHDLLSCTCGILGKLPDHTPLEMAKVVHPKAECWVLITIVDGKVVIKQEWAYLTNAQANKLDINI